MVLRLQLSKTTRGDQDYLQIMSEDLVSVNIVLIADRIEVKDDRKKKR